MKNYTVLQNEKGGRFFTNYLENYDGPNTIVEHCDTIEKAQEICNQTRDTNINIYINSLPKELQVTARKLLNENL